MFKFIIKDESVLSNKTSGPTYKTLNLTEIRPRHKNKRQCFYGK